MALGLGQSALAAHIHADHESHWGYEREESWTNTPSTTVVGPIEDMILKEIFTNCHCHELIVDVIRSEERTHAASVGGSASVEGKTGLLAKLIADAKAKITVSTGYTYTFKEVFTIGMHTTVDPHAGCWYHFSKSKRTASGNVTSADCKVTCTRWLLPDCLVYCNPVTSNGTATGWTSEETSENGFCNDFVCDHP